MANTTRWTAEEDARLIKIYHDNPKITQANVAELAIKYGMFPKRTASGIETRLCRLLKRKANGYVDFERKFNEVHGEIDIPKKAETAAWPELKGGAELHRFNNGYTDYSAIYMHGIECWSVERSRESDMIKRWNAQSDWQVMRWA